MEKSKSKKELYIQFKLTNKRVWDAYLILALNKYSQREDKIPLSKLFKKIVDEAMKNDQTFTAQFFPPMDKSERLALKDKSVFLKVTDKQQIEYLSKQQETMVLADYEKYLFLQYFYRSEAVMDSYGNFKPIGIAAEAVEASAVEKVEPNVAKTQLEHQEKSQQVKNIKAKIESENKSKNGKSKKVNLTPLEQQKKKQNETADANKINRKRLRAALRKSVL